MKIYENLKQSARLRKMKGEDKNHSQQPKLG